MPLVPSATEQQICLDRCGADGPPMYPSRLFMRVSTSLSLGPSHSTTLQSYPELCQVLTATNPPGWQRMPELQEGGVSDLLLGPHRNPPAYYPYSNKIPALLHNHQAPKFFSCGSHSAGLA